MNFTKVGSTTLALLLAWTFWLLSSGYVAAQDDEETPSGAAGVQIMANGVLVRNYTQDWGHVSRQRLQAARAMAQKNLSRDIQTASTRRYVSLNRMEKTLIDNNGVLTDEMRYLAGLQKIEYVFFLEETKDIVIAGPAEGWFRGPENIMVGMTSGRPVCELQDLATALRAYGPKNESPSVVGCSIDPTQEGNARMQEFIRAFGNQNPADPIVRTSFVNGLRNSLGMQTIRVDGIPATTHAAMVMVSADYRMKRMGIGVDPVPGGVKIETFISKVNPRKSGGNALFRWFFVPDYQSVVMTSDRTGMQLVGEGVKLVAEDEVVTSDGQRVVKAGKVNPACRDFSASFTKEYPNLAKRSLVFAQLRSFVDMLVCAAHIQKEGFYEKADWSMEFLGDEKKYAIETFSPPTQVEAVVGQAWRGGTFMAPIGGGVEITADLALNEKNVRADEKGLVSEAKAEIKSDLAPGQWWWD